MMAREHLSVQPACRVLHVAESGYSAWRDRPPSNRLVKHAWLTEAIVGMHTASRGTFGSRRVHAELGLVGLGQVCIGAGMSRWQVGQAPVQTASSVCS
ncbi:hypothetical protein ABZ358_52350, partial [Streptomyces mirabilis]